MRKLLLGGAALAALVAGGAANAADMPVYKAAHVEVFSWTGCYIGGHVGYGWKKEQRTTVTGEH